MKFRRLRIVSRNNLNSKPVYKEKYLKAKIKFYNEKINTNFHNNEIPREGSQVICFSVILINSVFNTGKNYYPQVFFEECRYVVMMNVDVMNIGMMIPK